MSGVASVDIDFLRPGVSCCLPLFIPSRNNTNDGNEICRSRGLQANLYRYDTISFKAELKKLYIGSGYQKFEPEVSNKDELCSELIVFNADSIRYQLGKSAWQYGENAMFQPLFSRRSLHGQHTVHRAGRWRQGVVIVGVCPAV